ncbi:hypothetical protein GPL21_00440 [Bradyrhizobium pachyrhizi]|uniref:NERD domain-containing protein n=1 Tax=Bradyrhizobium pachyrhizi TaxID=280333 RepID=A0A844SJE0_9BRAD|nr:hypothetical protein [Bradyrhizobium pachyrhizi]MVT63582.1 hypothetical protein [Bradyrhizobium pachyrhizi]
MQGEENALEGGTVTAGVTFRVLDAETVQAIGAEQRERAKQEAAAFPELMESLRSLLRTYYPPHLIAVFAGWGLRTAVGPQGVGRETMIKGVSQHHAELLQAFALALPAAEWGQEPAEMVDIQTTIDAVLGLAKAFAAKRMVAEETITDPLAATKRSLQERLRIHTQMVRNWGHYRSMLRILRDLYEPLNAAMREHHGFGALDVIAVAEHTVASIEAQVNERFRSLKDIFKARAIPVLIHDFFGRFPGVAGDPAQFLSSLDPGESLESVRARLLSHADRWLVVNSIAPVASIAMASGLSEAQTRAVLDRLSLRPGDLSGENPDHLFLANPVWMRPGIKSGDQYFFAFPQTAVTFLHQILRQLCEEAGLKVALEQRRSTFLEHETYRIISQALPGAMIMPAAKWTWGGDFETDVLAVLDRTVLIAECKSASLTPQGLRGAPERVRRHVVDLIADPAIQSSRLESVITRARGGDQNALAVARGLGLDPAEVDTVIRISVTLDDLTVLASAERELKAAGWVHEELELATTLNIADLICVADILPRPSQFLHYFSRRAQVQRAADVIGFELDFLGLYLATNFGLVTMDKRHRLVITEMSRDVDLHYQNVENGHPSDKPAPRLDPYFETLLDQLEIRRPTGWTTMAQNLLDTGGIDGQAACVESLEALRLDVSTLSSDPNHLNMLVVTPDGAPDLVVVFYVFSQADRPNRDETIRKFVENTLAQSGRSRCLFIGRMIESWDTNPYDVIGLVRAS